MNSRSDLSPCFSEAILRKLIPHKANNIPYLQFPSLSKQKGLTYGIFSRFGGFSEPPYNTLNVAYNVGDQPNAVKKNLEIIQKAMGAKDLLYMNQVHGRDVIILHREDPHHLKSGFKADGIITNSPQIGLMVKQADCQAIILFDPNRKVLANVHCGWRGNSANILAHIVRRMKTEFGCEGSDLMAGISPSLGPCCAEFITHKKIFDKSLAPFMVRENYFNLWAISRNQLLNAGLGEDNIEIAEVCSKCNTHAFYSYRAEEITGRSATVAMLTGKG